MSVPPLLNAAGRRRSPATLPGYLAGRPPRNKGLRYPPDPPTVEEIVAVMREAGDDNHGARLRALIVLLWRAGLRIQEALTLTEHDLEPRAGSVLVRHGKGGRRREVGMDPWGWEHLRPWLGLRMRRVHERWADPLASNLASGLLRVKERVETEGGGLRSTRPVVDVAFEVKIAAPPTAVFSALTEDPGGWWGHPFLAQQAVGLSLEPRLGGLFVERWDEGGSVIATVTGWSRHRHLELTGRFHLGVALGVATFDLARTDEGTLLGFAFRAVGAVDPGVAEQMAQGWNELIGTRLKALVEGGARLGIAPDPPNVHPIRTENRNG
jgi:uncharacterized protein YndB with AHSA1/START domain